MGITNSIEHKNNMMYSRVDTWMCPRIFLFFIFYFLFSPVGAQDSLLLRNYQFVKQYDPWLTGSNGAALTRYQAKNIAEAEIVLDKGNGGLVDFWQSDNTLQVGAGIESFYRLNKRAVVYGAISYDNRTGKGMTGSAFMHLPSSLSPLTSNLSSRYPFDIVEDSLTNPGRKHTDIYSLTGGVGFNVWKGKGYALGAKVSYTAANYAKYKDLRHKNKLMQLSVSLGAYAPVAKWLNLGANYTYYRQTESVDFGTYGKSDKTYKSLIDYGAFMGIVEQFGNEGYTDKAREMPLFEDSHGAALQVEIVPFEQLSIMGSVGISRGNGYYGRKSPFTATYTRHQRDINQSSLSLVYQPSSTQTRHRLDLSYTNEKLANKANTFRELVNENSANYYEYYDAVETGDKQWDDFDISYTLLLGIQGELPTWELNAQYHYAQRKQASYLYPYYRHQQLSTNKVALQATLNKLCNRGVWSFTLQSAWQNGSGTPYEDFTFATPSALQDSPATMQAFLYREYQYLTASQYQLGALVKYAFIIPKTRIKLHAKISGDYHKATKTYVYSTGNHHISTSISVGCTF